jgi:hypothetical protein
MTNGRDQNPTQAPATLRAHPHVRIRHGVTKCFCCGAIDDSGDRYCPDCVDAGCINDRVGGKCRMVQS